MGTCHISKTETVRVPRLTAIGWSRVKYAQSGIRRHNFQPSPDQTRVPVWKLVRLPTKATGLECASVSPSRQHKTLDTNIHSHTRALENYYQTLYALMHLQWANSTQILHDARTQWVERGDSQWPNPLRLKAQMAGMCINNP